MTKKKKHVEMILFFQYKAKEKSIETIQNFERFILGNNKSTP